MGIKPVVKDRRPFTIAVAAQIDRVTVIVGSEIGANEIPRARVQASPVEEQDRAPIRPTPLKVVKADAVDDDVAIPGKRFLLRRGPPRFGSCVL